MNLGVSRVMTVFSSKRLETLQTPLINKKSYFRPAVVGTFAKNSLLSPN